MIVWHGKSMECNSIPIIINGSIEWNAGGQGVERSKAMTFNCYSNNSYENCDYYLDSFHGLDTEGKKLMLWIYT